MIVDKIPQLISFLREQTEVSAIVLAGSHSYGTSTPESDIDLVIHYSKEHPLNISSLRRNLVNIDGIQVQKITEIGDWHKYMNGGIYLRCNNILVHIYYREIEVTQDFLNQVQKGEFETSYFDLPMNIFKTYYYCGHIRDYVVLYDPKKIIDRWKSEIKQYPTLLKEEIIRYHLVDIENTLPDLSSMSRNKSPYLYQFFVLRIVNNFIQVLYALNNCYFTTEKRVDQEVPTFQIKPEDFLNRVNSLVCPLKKPSDKSTIREIHNLFNELSMFSSAYYEVNYVNREVNEWF